MIAETATNGSLRVRLDRVGRPEIKNFIMMDRASDAVNRDLDIRDIYSEEDGFKLRPDYLGAYRARLNGSMAFYDGLDGKTDWPLDAKGKHPLTEMLLADFLVVDISKPFDENGYLEIERAMLRGAAHETCGGRWLNHDIVDTFLTIPHQQRQWSADPRWCRAGGGAGIAQPSRICRARIRCRRTRPPLSESLHDARHCRSADRFARRMAPLRSPTWRRGSTSFELHAARGQLTSRSWSELVDLLILRAPRAGPNRRLWKSTLALAEQRAARSLR